MFKFENLKSILEFGETIKTYMKLNGKISCFHFLSCKRVAAVFLKSCIFAKLYTHGIY